MQSSYSDENVIFGEGYPNTKGMMIALNSSIFRPVQHALPFYKLLRKQTQFEWNTKCNDEFESLKRILATPSILIRPSSRETLYLYLEVVKETVSIILIKETNTRRSQKYFILNALAEVEARYQKIEKVILTVVVASTKLRRYFMTHSIVVQKYFPLRHVLHRPYLAGRSTK